MQKKILFISHDANRAGSQLLLLQLLKILKQKRVPMELLLCGDGVVAQDFETVVNTIRLPDAQKYVVSRLSDKVLAKLGVFETFAKQSRRKRQAQLKEKLNVDQIGLVFINSIANAGIYYNELKFLHHLPVVLFAHELEMSANMYARRPELEFLLKKTDHLIAVAQAVADYYIRDFHFSEESVSILTLIDHDYIDENFRKAEKSLLKTECGIPDDAIVVGGCGNAEWRKGNDVFNWIARLVIHKTKPLPVYFVWVGAGEQHAIFHLIDSDIKRMELTDKILLIPPTSRALDYISRFDILLLSSREDPYPLVVMEAALNETPVICFEGAGGAPELIANDAGRTIPYMDIPAAAESIIQLILDPGERTLLGQRGRKKVLERHKTGLSIERIMTIIQKYLNLPLSETLDQ
jgi:glycosyltransferase involved in cell wall biosynthesis